jgi:TonB-dependent starch-binding outer membrane protein SusC
MTSKNDNYQVANDFNQGHIYDPLGLAEGRVAGLSITKPGDNPNTKYDARIRGLSNIHGNTMPLIVVDGYLDASLENVDPSDIESMTVIKDAAATAFYGIRGANGVILISTKKGDGKPQVSYNTYLNVENAIRRQPAMTRDEYLAFSDELDFAQATDFGYDTDWYNEILNTAISQAHNLSVSGGNLSTKYYGSLNYRNVNGVLANTGFDRFSTRFNVEHKALKRIS